MLDKQTKKKKGFKNELIVNSSNIATAKTSIDFSSVTVSEQPNTWFKKNSI